MVVLLRRCGAWLVAASLVLGACTSPSGAPDDPPVTPSMPPSTDASTSEGPGEGGTLRYGLGGNPISIDPRFVADDEGITVVDAVFDSLVALRQDLDDVAPAAAREWDVSEDGLTYTFHLRRGATYHDGSPVLAEDFVRAFQRIADGTADPRSFLAYQLAPVEGFGAAQVDGQPLAGVEALDATTLQIRLTHPMAEFLQVLGHPSLAPIPAAAVDRPDEFEERPIGNGPFAMAESWQPNQFIRVTRHADHHAQPRLDEVVFQIFADDLSRQQQYADFERGQVDVAEVPPASLTEAMTTYGRSPDGVTGPGVLDGMTGALYAYGFNTELPPFDQPAVRRAVTMLIDRDRIARRVLLGAREAADTLVPPVLPGGMAGRCALCRFDPEAARAEAGLGPLGGTTDAPTPTAPSEATPESTQAPTDPATQEPTEATTGPDSDARTPPDEDVAPAPAETGTEPPPAPEIGPIEIVVNSGTTNERIARRVAADMQRWLEVDVSVRTAEPAAFVDQLRAGQIQLFRLGWQADYGSPGAVLQPLFRTDAIGRDNLTRFSDPEVDGLLDEARRTTATVERNALYAQAEERILEQAPVAPVFFYRQNRVVADTVEDLRIDALGYVNLAEVWKRSAA